MNLAGIRRVMELEEEVARLRSALQAADALASQAVSEAERRQRRDLVPLNQSVAVFGEWGRAFGRERAAAGRATTTTRRSPTLRRACW